MRQIMRSWAACALVSVVSARPLRLPKILGPVLRMRGGGEAPAALTMYPGLTQEELLSKLNTIPVFVITDNAGNSVVFTDTKGEGKAVNYVFLQRELATQVAAAFEAQAETAGDSEAKGAMEVNDVPLGAIWEKLAKPGAAPVVAAVAEGAEEKPQSVEIRLMCDPVDLVRGRQQGEASVVKLRDSKLHSASTIFLNVPPYSSSSPRRRSPRT
jgi:hypothetical protein